MGGEILTLQAGQCGNQVGEQLWSQLCSEHGINSDGTTEDSYLSHPRNDRPDIFFQRNVSNKSFTPRAILIDLEPKVIGKIAEKYDGLFNPKNIFMASDGGGAANRWADGYLHGKKNLETVLDIIDRELDGCDNLEGFQLLHSIGGGTGSGFGSLLLETLSDRYSKKLIQTYSVFDRSGIVVNPYNSILTLKRLIQNSDANVVFNNDSLLSIAPENQQIDGPSFDNINKLISTVMSASTNTLRFPSYSYNSLTSIISTLIPTPDLHFITASYTPCALDYGSYTEKDVRRSTSYDVILELLDKKSNMFCTGQKEDKVLAMMDVIIGSKAPMDNKHNASIQKALIKARSRINFAPWTPSTIHLAMGQRSSFSTVPEDIVSGLMLSNSTSVLQVLRGITNDYDRLRKKSAFMNTYLKSDYDQECGDIMQEFQECREIVEALMGEYRASKTLAYMEGGDDEDEDEDEDDEEDENETHSGDVHGDGEVLMSDVHDPDHDVVME